VITDDKPVKLTTSPPSVSWFSRKCRKVSETYEIQLLVQGSLFNTCSFKLCSLWFKVLLTSQMSKLWWINKKKFMPLLEIFLWKLRRIWKAKVTIPGPWAESLARYIWHKNCSTFAAFLGIFELNTELHRSCFCRSVLCRQSVLTHSWFGGGRGSHTVNNNASVSSLSTVSPPAPPYPTDSQVPTLTLEGFS
jgi:hypothetical protein